MTIMVINSDPSNTANVAFSLNGFNPTCYVAYTLSSTASSAIYLNFHRMDRDPEFCAYSITLLVVTGTETSQPVWSGCQNSGRFDDSASGICNLASSAFEWRGECGDQFGNFHQHQGASACSGSLTLTNAKIAPTQPATITVNTGKKFKAFATTPTTI